MTLSIGEQKLLLEILKKGFVTKESQKTYQSKKFYEEISLLTKNGFVMSSDNGSNTLKYELTLKGEIFTLVIKSIEK